MRKTKEIEKNKKINHWISVARTSMGNKLTAQMEEDGEPMDDYEAAEQVQNASQHVQKKEGITRTRAESLYNPPRGSTNGSFDAVAHAGEDNEEARLGAGSSSVHRTGPKPVWLIVLLLCGIFVALCVALGVRCKFDNICSLTR
jgi:hypothetical protein